MKLPSISPKWKKRIKRGAVLFSLSLVGTFLVLFAFKQGTEVGRKVGHCEVSCSIMGAQFTALDGAAKCQCQYGSGWVMSIQIDHGFFDYENTEIDGILENN